MLSIYLQHKQNLSPLENYTFHFPKHDDFASNFCQKIELNNHHSISFYTKHCLVLLNLLLDFDLVVGFSKNIKVFLVAVDSTIKMI